MIGIKSPSSYHEKYHQTIISYLPNFIVGRMNSDKGRSPYAKTRFCHATDRNWTLIYHFREPVFIHLPSNFDVPCTTATEQIGFCNQRLLPAARPWKSSKCASLRLVFTKTTVPDDFETPGVRVTSVCWCFFEFLSTAFVVVYLLISWICWVKAYFNSYHLTSISQSQKPVSIWKCLIYICSLNIGYFMISDNFAFLGVRQLWIS